MRLGSYVLDSVSGSTPRRQINKTYDPTEIYLVVSGGAFLERESCHSIMCVIEKKFFDYPCGKGEREILYSISQNTSGAYEAFILRVRIRPDRNSKYACEIIKESESEDYVSTLCEWLNRDRVGS